MRSTIPAPESVTGAGDLDVAVVLVTYNSADVIERCLRAIPAALGGLRRTRVIVVDNASADGTPGLVRELAPWVVVHESGGNLGYAAAINLGTGLVDPRAGVMVLNPDTVPGPGSIERLARWAAGHPDAGVVVPRIEDEDGRLYPSLRREPTVLRALGEAVAGGHRSGRVAAFGEVILAEDRYVTGARADWATGAALFVTRRAADAVGPWSEDFFLYSEETDYALRVGDAGLAVTYVADSVVVHRGGDMRRSPRLWSLQVVNRIRLYDRRHGRAASALFWCAVALNESLRSVRSPIHRAALRALLTRRARPVPGRQSTGLPLSSKTFDDAHSRPGPPETTP